MSLKRCSSGGKAGYKWGHNGECHTYERSDKSEEAAAKARAIADGLATGKREARDAYYEQGPED